MYAREIVFGKTYFAIFISNGQYISMIIAIGEFCRVNRRLRIEISVKT